MQFAHPHYYEKSSGYIYLKILKLKGKERSGLLEAYRLGTLVHYLCDFCCYAHISGGIGAITGHVNYERKISKYLNKNYSLFHKELSRGQIKETKYADIISFIDEAIKQYKISKPSYLIDIKKSIEVSSALIFDMVSRAKIFLFTEWAV